MLTRSETWKQLAAVESILIDTRITIDETTYDDVLAPAITRALMPDSVSIGNAVAAMCTFSLDATVTLPRSAEVLMEMRLTTGGDEPTVSEWLPAGTFYISRRTKDPINGIIAFECYDAMLKANAPWDTTGLTFPVAMNVAANHIATLLGVQIDARTVMATGANYMIDEPTEGTLMRDILATIAGYNGGNWIITPENKLRLVRIDDSGEVQPNNVDVYSGNNRIYAMNSGQHLVIYSGNSSIFDTDNPGIIELYNGDDRIYDNSGACDISAVIGSVGALPESTITGIRCTYEDGTSYLAGDDTGIVVEATIPGVIATDLLDRISGTPYQPFTLTDAFYDPAIELGDKIKYYDLVLGNLVSEMITLDGAAQGTLVAPDTQELADEYPYYGQTPKTIAIAKAYVDAAITSLEEEFAEEVVNINSDIEDLQSQIDGNITTWFYAVDPTLNNPPAVDWTTTAERNNHLGDLYYNSSSGYCWRFMLENGTYSWSRISDTDITTALANAQAAQDTADSKRRVFVAQPTPPYDIGDLWVQGTNGDILKCVTAKTSGSYSASDWGTASKYTDDTAVTTLNNALTQQEVFDRLTGRGAAQGMVLTQDGQLFINASYIQSGTLTLGGVNNQNGTLQVLDDSGKVVGTWTEDGIGINSGSLQLKSEYRTEKVTVSIKENFSEPFKVLYEGANIDAQTNFDGRTIILRDNNTGAQLYLSPAEIYISESGAIWLDIAKSNSGVSSIRLISDDGDISLGPDRFYIINNGDRVLDVLYNNGNPVLYFDGYLSVGDAASTRSSLGITPANIGALPTAGGTMTGDINMGQSGSTSIAKQLKWTTTDGTVFTIRPYNNIFQIVRTPAGDSSKNALGFNSDGSISVENPAGWRSALGITPANIGAFGTSSLAGTITNANNTAYYGVRFLNGADCANLPDTSSNFELICMGNVQLAIQYNGSNPSILYRRYYVNSQWYAWRPVMGLSTAIQINTASWSDVYSKLSVIEGGQSAFFWITDGTVASFISGRSDLAWSSGIVTNTGSGGYRFSVLKPAGFFTWGVTGLTSASATGAVGTVSKAAYNLDLVNKTTAAAVYNALTEIPLSDSGTFTISATTFGLLTQNKVTNGGGTNVNNGTGTVSHVAHTSTSDTFKFLCSGGTSNMPGFMFQWNAVLTKSGSTITITADNVYGFRYSNAYT